MPVFAPLLSAGGSWMAIRRHTMIADINQSPRSCGGFVDRLGPGGRPLSQVPASASRRSSRVVMGSGPHFRVQPHCDSCAVCAMLFARSVPDCRYIGARPRDSYQWCSADRARSPEKLISFMRLQVASLGAGCNSRNWPNNQQESAAPNMPSNRSRSHVTPGISV